MKRKNLMTEKNLRKLKVEMAKKGLSLKQLTDGLGVNYRYIYNLIRQGNDATNFKASLRRIYGIWL